MKKIELHDAKTDGKTKFYDVANYAEGHQPRELRKICAESEKVKVMYMVYVAAVVM